MDVGFRVRRGRNTAGAAVGYTLVKDIQKYLRAINSAAVVSDRW